MHNNVIHNENLLKSNQQIQYCFSKIKTSSKMLVLEETKNSKMNK